MSATALMNNYGERTLTLVRGEGPFLFDDQGKRYLDAISGIAVCGLGYSHTGVTQALQEQAATLLHCSNLYLIESQMQLGQHLRDISGMEKVFFSNSGAEANEAAIKIARKYAHNKGIDNPEIITATRSFHGRTMATLSATGNAKVKTGFAPLLPGFVHVPFNDIEAIHGVANTHTVAIMVEPIQGEGGIHVPSASYLNELRALCDEKGWLLILDEIQSGNGRTGNYFAYQHHDILPDVLTTAKGLGNGVPIGACLARGTAADMLQPGSHGSTFGGNPLACSAGLAALTAINQPELLTRVSELGEYMLNSFKETLAGMAHVVDIRGKGLMIGIELSTECTSLVDQARQEGLLINVTCGNVIRLLPPFILNDDEAASIVTTVSKLIKRFTEVTTS